MSENKTQPTDASVLAFLNSVEHAKRKANGFTLLKLMEDVTGEPAKMWGDSIIGFGSYHYKYESGREGDWILAGFSPRKASLSVYIIAGFDQYDELLSKLGKHKIGKSCLYINKLEDVDMEVLKELVQASVAHMRAGKTPTY